jgi:putative membrane protein
MIRMSVFAVAFFLPALALAQAPAPSDAEIAHIAYTAGAIDIAAGEAAMTKATNAEVKEFAAEMVRDHKAVNEKALALVKALHVEPEDNATSQALTKAADAKAADLAKLSGAAYDKAYVENEVAFHKTVNAALKDTLIPDARNADLKALLETGLRLFQSHEMHAEHLAATLK